MQAIPKFVSELWKRRVVQFGAIYLGVAWVLLQVALAVEQTLHLPDWVAQVTLVFLLLGLPIVLIVAWVRDAVANEANNIPDPVAAERDPGCPQLPKRHYSKADRERLTDALHEISELIEVKGFEGIQLAGKISNRPQAAIELGNYEFEDIFQELEAIKVLSKQMDHEIRDIGGIVRRHPFYAAEFAYILDQKRPKVGEKMPPSPDILFWGAENLANTLQSVTRIGKSCQANVSLDIRNLCAPSFNAFTESYRIFSGWIHQCKARIAEIRLIAAQDR